MRKSVFRAAIACGVTAVAVIGGAGTAHAADSTVHVFNTKGVPAGTMKHIDNGDEFRVWDAYGDAKGVRGVLFDANFKVLKTVYNGKGANKGYVSFTYDIVAGKDYFMRVCRVDNVDDTSGLCNEKKVTE